MLQLPTAASDVIIEACLELCCVNVSAPANVSMIKMAANLIRHRIYLATMTLVNSRGVVILKSHPMKISACVYNYVGLLYSYYNCLFFQARLMFVVSK